MNHEKERLIREAALVLEEEIVLLVDVNPGGREELGDSITLVPPVVGEKPGKSGPSVPEELQERRRDHWMAAMWNNAPTVSGMCFGK